MPKILSVFMDGTWNEPNDQTNVYALYSSAQESSSQKNYYIEGVGTQGKGLWAAVDKLMGGAFGVGLSSNIIDGYRWICQHYQAGDRIFLFGFSRGAYTARSLAGMIRKSGLVRDTSDEQLEQAYDIYRDKDYAADDIGPTSFRKQYSHEPTIEFVGVWDTVGALGIPVKGVIFPGFSSFYNFHDTNLSNRVLNAYHAIAANEFRSLYEPTLWTVGKTERPPNFPVEQRWFVGAHSDVGGGYEKGVLQFKPALWIQQKAGALGMKFDPLVKWIDTYDTADPHDSFVEFQSKFSILTLRKAPRLWGTTAPLNMTIDSSLKARLNNSKDFLRNYPDFHQALVSLETGK